LKHQNVILSEQEKNSYFFGFVASSCTLLQIIIIISITIWNSFKKLVAAFRRHAYHCQLRRSL